jgi:hypothetical protein
MAELFCEEKVRPLPAGLWPKLKNDPYLAPERGPSIYCRLLWNSGGVSDYCSNRKNPALNTFLLGGFPMGMFDPFDAVMIDHLGGDNADHPQESFRDFYRTPYGLLHII